MGIKTNDLNGVFVGENSLLIRLQKQLLHYIVNRIGGGIYVV